MGNNREKNFSVQPVILKQKERDKMRYSWSKCKNCGTSIKLKQLYLIDNNRSVFCKKYGKKILDGKKHKISSGILIGAILAASNILTYCIGTTTLLSYAVLFILSTLVLFVLVIPIYSIVLLIKLHIQQKHRIV